MSAPVALVGLPGSGKSTVGRAVAGALDLRFIDVDELIEARANKSIARIFKEDGEPAFRTLERESCASLLSEVDAVCAFGGGAFADNTTRHAWSSAGIAVWLDAPVRACAERIAASSSRPVVDEGGRVASLTSLLVKRRSAYRTAPIRIDARGELNTVVGRAVDAVTAARSLKRERTLTVHTDGPSYDITFAQGGLTRAGEVLRAAAITRGAVLIVTQENLAPHLPTVQTALEESGYTAHVFVVDDGEGAKRLEVAAQLYGEMAKLRLSRDAAVIALGGGVVGDLAGFVAATFKRGLHFIQIPTTVLAMVDSSVGGKVAVNLPEGKNLVGHFYPPRAVLVDPEVLSTLPEEEIAAGMAEVIKHALIDDVTLLDERPLDVDLLARAVDVKRRVVEQDPDERGLRAILNLGHTFAHALEHTHGYRVRHGHAVSVGLVAALALSERVCGSGRALTDRVEAHLVALGCPVRARADVSELIDAMENDKKATASGARLVVCASPGHASVVKGIAREDINAAWQRVLVEDDAPVLQERK